MTPERLAEILKLADDNKNEACGYSAGLSDWALAIYDLLAEYRKSEEAHGWALAVIANSEAERDLAYAKLAASHDQINLTADARVFAVYGNKISELFAERDHLKLHIDTITAERDKLSRWKAEALEVENEWDVQGIGSLLGLPVGARIRKEIKPAIDAQAARIAELEEQVRVEVAQKSKLLLAREPVIADVVYEGEILVEKLKSVGAERDALKHDMDRLSAADTEHCTALVAAEARALAAEAAREQAYLDGIVVGGKARDAEADEDGAIVEEEYAP